METTVSLVQMLDARERRVQHQQELLARYHKPLICFTMNICGPIKDSPLIRQGFARGRQLLRQQFLRAKADAAVSGRVREVTGCEAFYVLDADPLTIKKIHHRHRGRHPAGAAVRHGRHPSGRPQSGQRRAGPRRPPLSHLRRAC